MRKVLIQKNTRVYNTSSQGLMHEYLHEMRGYVCSEFFPDVEAGSIHNGVRCEDLQNLSFEDGSFDLIISEDVLEHVRKPNKAFESMRRVLKVGGYHVFTVPIHGEKTTVRVDVSGESDNFVLPPVYHGDPLRAEGALAYNDFGTDILELMDSCGFESEVLKYNVEKRKYMCGHVIVSKKKE